MHDPDFEDSPAAPPAAPAPEPVQAVPGDAAACVIRAQGGKWPEPPTGGRWVRNAITGDLTRLQAPADRESADERQARRARQRQAALAAQTTPKE